MAYIGQSLTEGTRRAYTFVATSGQTTFNAVYGVGAVDVYQNGILLQPSDYNSSSGSSVVLGVGAAVNDEITIIAHNTFSVADTVSSSQGGTFAGNVSMSGTLGVTGAVTVDGNITTGNTSVVTGGRFVSSQTSNDPWLKGVNSSNTETSFIKKDGQIYSAFGISLGGTGASNTLNDYEEGTWTAAFASQYGSITVNNSYKTGQYTKIGNTVHINIHIRASAISSPSGNLTITGLPFSTPNNTDYRTSLAPAIHFSMTGMGGDELILAYISNNSNVITLASQNGNNIYSAIAARVTASSELYIGGHYSV